MSQKNNKPMVVTAALIIVLIIAGVAAAFVFSSGSSKKKNSKQSTVTTSAGDTTQATTTDEQTLETSDDSTTDEDTTTDEQATITQDEIATEADTTIEEDNTADTEDTDEEATEPMEVTVPDMDGINELMPEGTKLSRYWYSKMNDDEYNEIVVAYAQDGQAKLLALGVENYEYKILWNEEIPGASITDLQVSDRNGDGVYEIAVWTSQSGSSFFDMYQYSDEGPTALVLSGGTRDGENTKISLGSSQVSQIKLDDYDDNGKDEIIFYLPLAEGSEDQYIDRYEWDGDNYTFVEQVLLEPAGEGEAQTEET